MTDPAPMGRPVRLARVRRWLARAWNNPWLWGLLGWLLLILRYTSEVVLPQYGR